MNYQPLPMSIIVATPGISAAQRGNPPSAGLSPQAPAVLGRSILTDWEAQHGTGGFGGVHQPGKGLVMVNDAS